MIRFIIAFSLFSVGYCKILTFTDCGSVGAKINSLDISPCDSDPCVLHHSTNYTAKVNFTALEDAKAAKTVVHGIIAGAPVPFPVPSDGCANNNLKCPLTSGTTEIYSNFVYCSPAYPKIRLAVKWEVLDESGKDIFCFIIPVAIQ